MTAPVAFGLVATVGTGTTAEVPNIFQKPYDNLPFGWRWLWLEQRAPVVVAWDGTNQTVVWGSSPANEPSDSHGQVLAPAMAAGNTLNIWATWAGTQNWDTSGLNQLWGFANCLVRSP